MRRVPTMVLRGVLLALLGLGILVCVLGALVLAIPPGSRTYALDVLAHPVWRGGPIVGVVCLLIALASGATPKRSIIVRLASVGLGLASALLIALALGAGAGTMLDRADAGQASHTPQDAYRSVSVAQYNWRIDGNGAEDNAFVDWLLERDPDVVSLVECWASVLARHPELAERYPHRVEPEPGKSWSILVLSKHPFRYVTADDRRRVEFPPGDDRIMWSFAAARTIRVEIDGTPAFLFSTFHFTSPRSESLWRIARTGSAYEAVTFRELRSAQSLPMIVAGDLNSTPSGAVYQRFAELSGMRAVGGAFSGGTWPAELPSAVSLPIDWVWASRDVRAVRREVGPRGGSDHRPIYAELRVPMPAQHDTDAPR